VDKSSSQPDPDVVYGLFSGIFKAQIVRLALQLDVFTPLADGPTTAESVAHVCRCDILGTKALLDYLGSLQVLERHEGNYSLTPTAETFLVPWRKSYVGDMILHYTGQTLFDSILRSIQGGKPSSLGEDFVQDAWLESYLSWRISSSLEMWQAAGIEPDPHHDLHILDIACGCATKSLVLAQASPRVRVTCLDTPDVLAVARDLAERMQVTSQVTFVPANLLQADLGKGQYDAVLLGQITHYLTETQNTGLFRRIHTALLPDGVLVVDCPMTTDRLTETASFLTLFLWANSGGMAYPFETYRTWLRNAGFRSVMQLSFCLAVYRSVMVHTVPYCRPSSCPVFGVHHTAGLNLDERFAV
jgi:2-polyprenyl-3-methyl-5-hydroxy-6-metoxy-1,4-benzoquinol methylase